jgi:hypothetical protein
MITLARWAIRRVVVCQGKPVGSPAKRKLALWRVSLDAVYSLHRRRNAGNSPGWSLCGGDDWPMVFNGEVVALSYGGIRGVMQWSSISEASSYSGGVA